MIVPDFRLKIGKHKALYGNDDEMMAPMVTSSVTRLFLECSNINIHGMKTKNKYWFYLIKLKNNE